MVVFEFEDCDVQIIEILSISNVSGSFSQSFSNSQLSTKRWSFRPEMTF